MNKIITISMFELLYPTFKINKPIRLIELFAGVGSQAMALRNLGTEFEHHKVVEFDKYAIASYNAIHDTEFETKDIIKVKGKDLDISEKDKYTYIMTYSFPCQDLSVAGNMKGMSKDSGTRSGLLWEVERLLNEVDNLPQVLLMENVPQVISQANIKDFHKWQRFLEEKGYSNYADTLNAKDYGIPQNRERTFMISILGDYYYKFPQGFNSDLRLKDLLENEVEDKYYIDNERIKSILNWKAYQRPLTSVLGNKSTTPTLTARGAGELHSGMILYSNDLENTTNLEPKVAVKQGTKKGFDIAVVGDNINLAFPNSEFRRGRVGKGVAQTLDTSCNQATLENDYRIRKLTPLECWRLMGFNDEDFYKAEEVNSNNQLYKQAGNSIVVDVLEGIFKQML